MEERLFGARTWLAKVCAVDQLTPENTPSGAAPGTPRSV